MQTQPTVSFDGVAVDDAVRDAALAHVAKLETFCRDIIGCHVVLSQPHRHPRHGRLWSVRVDLVVPGVDIIVNRTHCRDQAHEDPLVALRDAFDAAKRRLEEHVRERRGQVGGELLDIAGQRFVLQQRAGEPAPGLRPPQHRE